MPFCVASAWSLTSTRSPATSCTPSMRRRPPAARLRLPPVVATRTGGNDPEINSVLPAMELMGIGDPGMAVARREKAMLRMLVRLTLVAALFASLLLAIDRTVCGFTQCGSNEALRSFLATMANFFFFQAEDGIRDHSQ